MFDLQIGLLEDFFAEWRSEKEIVSLKQGRFLCLLYVKEGSELYA